MLAPVTTISPVGRKRLIVLGLLVTALSMAALAFMIFGLTGSGRGISKEHAIQAAWQHVDKGALAVTSAEVRENFHTGFDIPTHSRSWVVTFAGQWHLLCEAGAGCDPTSEWVAIDYYTGDWIASQDSYPAGH